MSFKLHRRVSPRAFAISAILLTVLLCVYYSGLTSELRPSASSAAAGLDHDVRSPPPKTMARLALPGAPPPMPTCPKLNLATTDIDTLDVFRNFEFQPAWMKNKEYWDKSFEDRFERLKTDQKRPPLKVILIPHSHNDPGWLKTFEQYFHYESRLILNNMVSKLQEFPNMTFIWSEISFLSTWWDQAHPTKQKALKKLVQEGRVEITTGGWVMTDEANSHVFAMVDQLIEGHQWLKTNLNFKPVSGWSIDPFGHGSTVPYLLSMSGITGTIIQRIHYAWKQWFAKNQYGDFYWVPQWASPKRKTMNNGGILTHNQPFDIYSIKHSCGPHPYICLNFDFRKLVGEYTEQSIRATNIDEKNVKRKSELLLEQYARTGSLFPHNVVLMPLGDDFRYNHRIEWDQQYGNYKLMADYINAHKEQYNAEITFGTPKDYFAEILSRYKKYPKLRGDFFVYSDIFTEGRPAYWSGYFTTRPFMKILDRELEHHLRSAEIVYTLALNRARQHNLTSAMKVLDLSFEKLVKARQHLGLFQHHDAITGTSKYFVMKDYGLKLFESIQDTVNIQQDAIQSLLFNDTSPSTSENTRNFLLSDIEYESSEKLPRKLPINIDVAGEKQIVLYNSLGQAQDRVVQIRTTKVGVKILDADRKDVIYQINPIWNVSNLQTLQMMQNEFEVMFVAKLPAFSLVTYYLVYTDENHVGGNLAIIYCNNCQRDRAPTEAKTSNQVDETVNQETPPEIVEDHSTIKASKFKVKNTQPGDIQLENTELKLLFDGPSGFLKTITRKRNHKVTQCAINFAAYPSAQFHSGAYLFMPDPNTRETIKNVLEQYQHNMYIIITTGPIASELTVIYGPFLIHTVRIYHTPKSMLSGSIYIENEIDFEKPPKNRETELFMRFVSDVQNGDPPEFYSDLNGFQMQKRVKVERIGIEGNYFPITTMTYIEDADIRLSLLTNHAQGAASWEPGHLEVMLDRRTLYDDSRGMGEGLVDNKKTVTQFWLLLEDVTVNKKRNKRQVDENFMQPVAEDEDIVRTFNIDGTLNEKFSRPSLFANQMSNSLNYPVNIYIMDKFELAHNPSVSLLSKFPCDMHLMNLRTQPDAQFPQFPAASALMVLHRQGYDCDVGNAMLQCDSSAFSSNSFPGLTVSSIQKTSLTGLHFQGLLNDFADLSMPPMSLNSLNISFANN